MNLEQPIAVYSGSPQVEDGYTKIANELLDEIILFKFSLRQIKVILAIIRKTYGFNKKEDDISLSQIGAMCQLPSSHVSKEINSLVEMNVVRKRAGRYGHILSLNKNYDEWTYLESSGKSDKIVTNESEKNHHYIYKITNAITKEFYIGVRSCLCLPAQDRYLGSGNWIASQNKRQLDKLIIDKYDTRELAEIAEAEQIRLHIDNPLNRNKRMYLSTSKQLHNVSPITESVTLQNTSFGITESVTEVLQNPSPQKTTPKDNTKDICIECLNYLNEKAKRAYRPVDSNLNFIKGRLKEGYTKEDIIYVIDVKTSQWLENPTMNEFLRPATLFNATKFSQYVAEKIKVNNEAEVPEWKKKML